MSILGYTQGGTTYNGPPLIVLNGASAGTSANGLDFAAGSSGSEVQGLVIQKFGGDGILINGTSGNLIAGNYIGTDSTGTAKLGNSDGVYIENGATANTVGGASSGAANVISGNSNDGLRLTGSGITGNVVLGNLIGTDKNGTANLGNSEYGVAIVGGATGNTLGGSSSAAANVVSGNGSSFFGVYLGGSGTSGNVVLGNLIGTDIHGTAKLGNGVGVAIEIGATGNTVGGTSSGAANVISGNQHTGLYLNFGASGNVVLGNLIGTDIHGTANLGNFYAGVDIDGATANTVGGTSSGAANVISGNTIYGVYLGYNGTSGNVVLGNLIGTDIHGTATLGNSAGVGIALAKGNTVGGTFSGAANVISGNSASGVQLYGSGTRGNVVLGNLIGTDITGTTILGNSKNGVIIQGATANTVGGTSSGAANVICGNKYGVYLGYSGTIGNVVLGNLIGTDKTGTAILGNTSDGVFITNSATANTIGGSAAGANVISGNTGAGVEFDVAVSSNTVSFNSIGTNKAKTAALPNGVGLLFSESNDTIGAGSAADPSVNTIAGNTSELQLAGNNNVLLGLSIGPAAKTLGLPNGTGVLVTGNSNTVGGTTSAARNVISANSA